jgi:hypothetical protein
MSRPRPRRFRGFAAAVITAGIVTGIFTVGETSRSRAEGPSAVAPTVGRSETLGLVSGTVSVRLKGTAEFVPLTGSISLPDGSEVDAGNGRVELTAATLEPGRTVTAEIYGGRFLLQQDSTAPAETHLVLSQPLPNCGPVRIPERRGRPRAGKASAHSSHPAKSRQLWASDSGGSWGTSGRYVTTTVEGTRWLTTDECRRSRVKVAEGIVIVHDLIRNSSVPVRAGHEYVAVGPPAEGAGYVPPRGEVLAGETGASPFEFQEQVGKHGSVFGFFGSWGGEFASLLGYVESLHARLLLHLSTDVGYGSAAGQEISPSEIAKGLGDHYLLSLCNELARSTVPVYLALLPEMNQTNNAYSAFNPNGSSRGPSNSTDAFRQAWRRTVLILRGGSVANINRRLHSLDLPPLSTTLAILPRPKVSFLWAPQTAGTPDIPANSPAAYFPGGAYVDIVGTDFYSAFPNFAGLESLYRAYPGKAFGFNEWAMWKDGDPGFVSQLFGFVRTHRRVALMVYNEGLTPGGPFRLTRFPAATAEIRRQLSSSRFLAYPPE